VSIITVKNVLVDQQATIWEVSLVSLALTRLTSFS